MVCGNPDQDKLRVCFDRFDRQAIGCNPCAKFFALNAPQHPHDECEDGDCNINYDNNKKRCVRCRFKRCLEIGMKVERKL